MASMYPDLNEGENTQVKSNETVAYSGPDKKNDVEVKNKEGGCKECCDSFAHVWVALVGFFAIAFGGVMIGLSLYAKFAYSNYTNLSEALPTGGIWYLLGVGAVVVVLGVLLMLSLCCRDEDGAPKPFFKVILITVSVLLVLLLILEISAGGIMIYSFGVMGETTVPPSDTIGNEIISRRNSYTNKTYYTCCVQYKPPYNSTIDSIIDDTCKWPKWNGAVAEKCAAAGHDDDPYLCVCEAGPDAYGAYFGAMLQASFMWIGIIACSSAFLLIMGAVYTSYLGCLHCRKNKDEKKSDHEYDPNA